MSPEHANHLGNVHGGVIMKIVDETAAIVAMRHVQGMAVTVAVDSMTFRRPIHIGDIVICTGHVTWVSEHSMEIRVTVKAEHPISGAQTHTNTAHLVFVAIDKAGRPTEVPGLELETDAEHALFNAGKERQARRLRERSKELD